jgi:hypothetical protein
MTSSSLAVDLPEVVAFSPAIHARLASPDGRDSRQYLAKLAELEKQAKVAKKGAWRFTGGAPPAQSAPVAGAYLASRKSEVFHKAGCKSAAKIQEKNAVHYATRDEANKSGKRPCAVCRP